VHWPLSSRLADSGNWSNRGCGGAPLAHKKQSRAEDEKYSAPAMIKGVFPRDSLTEGSEVVWDDVNLLKRH